MKPIKLTNKIRGIIVRNVLDARQYQFPIPKFSGLGAHDDKEHLERHDRYEKELKQWRENKEAFTEDLTLAVGLFYTVEELQEAWPALVRFVPEVLKQAPATYINLPELP